VTPDTPIRLKPAPAKTPAKRSISAEARSLFSEIEVAEQFV
jgi:hypothetical protein